MCIFEILFRKFLLKKPYIPKDVTQQELFLSKNPKFDGRGIKIAIIDSGVDVSMDGMQTTSEGLPKIIDCFDFAGVGDVDTSVVKEMSSENILIGLSGRKFKIPKKWKNPSGKWHLGIKALFKPDLVKVSEKLPELDCIVWFDGEKWLACIETRGNLKKAKILTNFRDSHEHGILVLKNLKIPYCVTVQNGGNLLQIFTSCYHHGSVVAQIAAAQFFQNPERNGLAPGAQIVSMSVWDYGKDVVISMEAVIKAFLKCIEMKVDMINLSFNFAGNKEIDDLVDEMTSKHNILIFNSSGNFGPFYGSTAPHGFQNLDAIFTIGAVLTSEMKKRFWNISSPKNSPPVVHSFSSRGPAAMNSRGLHFVAPGAAIATMARFNTRKYQYREGTSLSSPNAAGAVACLISGLKTESIQYSRASIKFALAKTAFLPENGNKFGFGHGMIQIDAAFDYYKISKNMPSFPTDSKGILFIGKEIFCEEYAMDLSEYIDVEAAGDAAAKWTMELCPKAKTFMELSKVDVINKSFSIKIDANKLEEGTLNYAEIKIMDPLIGSILHIPVNAIHFLNISETRNLNFQKEITLNQENAYYLHFGPFFQEEKTCQIQITALENTIKYLFVEYIVHDDKDRLTKALKTQKLLKFNPKNPKETYSMSIKKREIPQVSLIHQLCIRQAIGSPAKSMFNLQFAFEND